MPEEPREPGRDRGAVSPAGEELAYVTNALVAEFPTLSRAHIVSVLETSKVEIAPSITTDDLLTRARERLHALIGNSPTVAPARPESAQALSQARKTGPSRAP